MTESLHFTFLPCWFELNCCLSFKQAHYRVKLQTELPDSAPTYQTKPGMDRKAKKAMVWKHHRRETGVIKLDGLSESGGCSLFALEKKTKTNTFPDKWVRSEISLVPLILLLIKHLVCATLTRVKVMRKVPVSGSCCGNKPKFTDR